MTVSIRQENPPICIATPESQQEVLDALQMLKERNIVILNLSHLTSDRARRAVDLFSGCICAIDGQSAWVGDKTYLFTPNNVILSK